MNIKNLILFFSLILISFAGCRKDSMTTEMIDIPHEPEINIETTLNGFITDRNGEPISDAEVSILNSLTQTNEFGFFEITGLVNEKFAVINVEKSGYFNQHKTIIPSRTSINQTRIQLTEKGAPKTIASNVGGQITIFQNSIVQFQPNSFVDEQGNSYNGSVDVYSFFIDPTDPQVDEFMPGNLMALNTENDIQILKSFGMVKVELIGDSGQKLNINKAATLVVEVPNSILNNAPTEIPLWHFDEEKGLWIEEGKAVLQNGKYTGEVAHFSFWNCDSPATVTLLKGKIINDLVIPPFSKYRIKDPAENQWYVNYTDSNGDFNAGAPKNTPVLLEVLEYCPNLGAYSVVSTTSIDPFTEDEVDLGTINITSQLDIFTISGTLVDCNGNPISNGQVILSNTVKYFPQQTITDSNGNFSITTSNCGQAEIEITGIDVVNGIPGNTQTYSVSSNISVGNLPICNNNIVESVVFTIDGNNTIIPGCDLIIGINSIGEHTYTFEFEETNFAGVTIYYNWTFTDKNNDLSNPLWEGSTQYTPPTGNEEYFIYTNMALLSQNVEIIQEAINAGDIMSLKITDAVFTTLEHDGSGNYTEWNYADCTAIINGKLQ